MPLAHLVMLTHEFLKKVPDIVLEETPLIIFDSISAVFMENNGKDNNHTRHISRWVHYVRHGEKWKIHNIDWCEAGKQLAEIASNNVGENDLNPQMKYMMVSIYKCYRTLVQEG